MLHSSAVFICVFVCAHRPIFVYIYICTFIFVYMHLCVCVRVYVCLCVCVFSLPCIGEIKCLLRRCFLCISHLFIALLSDAAFRQKSDRLFIFSRFTSLTFYLNVFKCTAPGYLSSLCHSRRERGNAAWERCRRSGRSAAVHVGGRAGRHCTAGQSCYAPLGRHLAITILLWLQKQLLEKNDGQQCKTGLGSEDWFVA